MPERSSASPGRTGQAEQQFALGPPPVTLPKGGGALRGIDETFQVNPVTGSAGFSIPLPASPGRSGFQPSLSLAYDSGAGNGPFGLGWQLDLPSIRRKTDKGLPRYRDAEDSDTFVLAGAEDLVPARVETAGEWRDDVRAEPGYVVRRYRPRVEGAFARIERWTHEDTGDAFWRTVTRDNVARVYGRTTQARVADPDAPARVFEWLLEEESDERGNVIAYEYAAEDRVGVDQALPYEGARARPGHRCTYVLPKRIRYGNAVPGTIEGHHFELVFDYGDHDEEAPEPEASRAWPVRPDIHSSFRAGFDVRCYRLCRRVLMFHIFPELGSEPALVSSTDFTYLESPVVSYLSAVTQSGYVRRVGGYEKESVAPVEYEYSSARIDETVQVVDGVEDLPPGTDPAGSAWVDLDGQGMSGLLSTRGPAWYYKANDGDGALAPAQSIGSRPSLGVESFGGRLMDLGGDGTLDLVQYAPGLAGYQPREGPGTWGRFQAFASLPSVDWGDANLRAVDLNGDGHTDLFVTEDGVLRWHPSEARRGFGAAEWVARGHDEALGPTLMFASDSASLFLADMTGDGLGDIVRITNGSVCYWPNRGYGRFGARIVMANAPRFDAPDRFDPRRLRIGDIDGTGTNDLIYLGRDRVSIAFNRSGNGFEDLTELSRFSGMDSVTDVSVVDLLGDGTACLVWFSPLPQHARRPLRYVHLMAEGKPHLLTRTVNNRGGVTTLRYRPSTHFSREDRKAGRPWITRLPFPVHVLESVEISDEITGRKFVTRYAYHHGYFDGEDREFRGFGLVEQFDAASFSEFASPGVTNADPAHHQPPVRTCSWFHTGAWIDGARISRHFEDEYYQGDSAAALLPDTTLPEGLSTIETREACRALKGRMLRQEIYADDGTVASADPYSVVEQSFTVRRVQPAGEGDRGAFQVLPGEVLTWQYERNADDPRVAHTLTLATDAYGHPTSSATLAYPRRSPAYDEQAATHVVVDESGFINQDDRLDAYHLGVPSETRAWELAGLSGDDTHPFSAADLKTAFDDAVEVPFETPAVGSAVQKRLIGHQRMLYRSDDLVTALPLGEIGTRAISFEAYRLALTDGLVDAAFEGRVTETMLADEAGYRRWPGPEADTGWWTPSGRSELGAPEAAAQRFFFPTKVIDPLGAETSIGYDPHLLTATRLEDGLGNVTEAELDYRLLQPRLVTDPNGNRTAVAFDALGRVTAQALMGKESAGEGDTLADPTVRFAYEHLRWLNDSLPNRVRTYAREIHADPQTRCVESVLYTDGSGNAALTKAQAEPGLAPARDADGALETDANGDLVWAEAAPRWVGSGRQVVDNKGNTVKQYEPYFSATDEYETEAEVVERGVTPILGYDPLGRNTRTDLPDGTFSRVELDPWEHRAWDANDTVLESDWYAARIAGQLGADAQRAAQLAEAHADTPAVVHLDVLGRTFLTVADDGVGGLHETRIALDIQGNELSVTDALNRVVDEHDYDVLGAPLRSTSMDAGRSWTLSDAAGKPVYGWDGSGRRLRRTYDVLGRPEDVLLQAADPGELLIGRTTYGDLQPDAERRNLRGQVHQSFDGAGVATTDAYDFKGNPLTSTRQLAVEYKRALDWSTAVALESETFRTSTVFDALNRPVSLTTPDGAVVRHVYNEASLPERVEADLAGAAGSTTFVADIDYDAKGRRELVEYGNGVVTRYEYDALTSRLAHLETTHGTERLQDLSYTYDPVGNVTHIRDDAQQTIFFRNRRVEPQRRLHLRRDSTGWSRRPAASTSARSASRSRPRPMPRASSARPLHPGRRQRDGSLRRALRLRRGRQHPGSCVAPGRRRQLDAALRTTPSPACSSPARVEQPPQRNPASAASRASATRYDAHGNMTRMPHLPLMRWNFARPAAGEQPAGRQRRHAGDDLLRLRRRRAAGAQGHRTPGARRAPHRRGRTSASTWAGSRSTASTTATARTTTLERETLHVDGRHAARRAGRDAHARGATAPRPRSSSATSSATTSARPAWSWTTRARIISYEEYYPYGSTSYQAVEAPSGRRPSATATPGMERDEETGLAYHGARYYAPWLGRWTSCRSRRAHRRRESVPVRGQPPDAHGGSQRTRGGVAVAEPAGRRGARLDEDLQGGRHVAGGHVGGSRTEVRHARDRFGGLGGGPPGDRGDAPTGRAARGGALHTAQRRHPQCPAGERRRRLGRRGGVGGAEDHRDRRVHERHGHPANHRRGGHDRTEHVGARLPRSRRGTESAEQRAGPGRADAGGADRRHGELVGRVAAAGTGGRRVLHRRPRTQHRLRPRSQGQAGCDVRGTGRRRGVRACLGQVLHEPQHDAEATAASVAERTPDRVPARRDDDAPELLLEAAPAARRGDHLERRPVGARSRPRPDDDVRGLGRHQVGRPPPVGGRLPPVPWVQLHHLRRAAHPALPGRGGQAGSGPHLRAQTLEPESLTGRPTEKERLHAPPTAGPNERPPGPAARHTDAAGPRVHGVRPRGRPRRPARGRRRGRGVAPEPPQHPSARPRAHRPARAVRHRLRPTGRARQRRPVRAREHRRPTP